MLRMNKFTLYIVFVGSGGIVNLFVQEAVFYVSAQIVLALIFGTAANIVVKYFLVKKHIFAYEAETRREEAKTFFKYGLLGVFPTVLFWITEMGFYYYWSFGYGRHVGAVVGLIISSFLKYVLDQKYVFTQPKRTA